MSSSERPSPEPLQKKRGVPSRTEGETILEMVFSGAPNALNNRGLGYPSRTLERNSRKSSESVSGEILEFLLESPSRTWGMAYQA